MLKVWRGSGRIFAECTECGSYGTAPHLQPIRKMAPEIEDALERHTAHMMALRAHYTKAVAPIMAEVKSGSMKRADAAKKVETLWRNHVAQVQIGTAQLPDLTGKITEVVVKCPWCDKPSDEIEIETLPEDVKEPNFSLAVKVVPKPSQEQGRS